MDSRGFTGVLLLSLVALITAQAPRVRITINGHERTGQNMPTVEWHAPIQRQPLYCSSETPATNLVFWCPSCNLTNATENAFDQQLRRKTKSLTQTAGYPLAMLENMRLVDWMNGKVIACNASYTNVGRQETITARTTLNVIFMDNPVITNQAGARPLGSSLLGYNMFVQQGGSITLVCSVNANPQPTTFVWRVNGVVQKNSQGRQIQLSEQQIRHGLVQCGAADSDGRMFESVPVTMNVFVKPKLIASNLNSLVKQNSKVELGRRISPSPQCQAQGYPAPIIIWRLKPKGMSGYANALNVTCLSNRIISSQPPANVQSGGASNADSRWGGGGGVPTNQGGQTQDGTGSRGNGLLYRTYECELDVKDYHMSGDLYCAACNEVASGQYTCDPAVSAAPQVHYNLNVVGPPLVNASQTIVRKTNDDRQVQMLLHFCANPPVDPEKSYWDVSGTKIHFGKSGFDGRYTAYQLKPNNTFPVCYQAVLEVAQLAHDDASKAISLVLNNAYPGIDANGVVTRIDAKHVLGNGGGGASEANTTALVLGILLPILAVLFILLLIFLWVRKKCCFAPKKNVDQRYQSNVVQQGRNGFDGGVRREPEPLPHKTPPPPHTGSSLDGYSNAGSEQRYSPKMSSV